MKLFLICICVFIALQNNFTSSSPVPLDTNNPILSETDPTPDSSKTTTLPSAELTSSLPPLTSQMDANISPQPQGRNMDFGDSPEDILMLAPLPENYDVLPDSKPPVLVVKPVVPSFEPYLLNFEDSVVIGPTSQEALIIPQPLSNLPYLPVITNPSDDSDDDDMDTAEQIVFRPLFAYRKQTERRRRIYSKPSSASDGQRRQQSYPSYGSRSYGSPSYGSPSYGSPSYGSPSYGSPSYGSPSYGSPYYYPNNYYRRVREY